MENESNPSLSEDNEEYTPKLFSDEQNYETEEKNFEEKWSRK